MIRHTRKDTVRCCRMILNSPLRYSTYLFSIGLSVFYLLFLFNISIMSFIFSIFTQYIYYLVSVFYLAILSLSILFFIYLLLFYTGSIYYRCSLIFLPYKALVRHGYWSLSFSQNIPVPFCFD